MLNRKPAMKKYLLSIPLTLWDRLLSACGNEWGKVAQFIREAIQEKLDRDNN
jgi:hypothetical protein